MREILKTAVILTPYASEEDARRAISAAHALNTQHCEIWGFGICEQILGVLPVDTVIRIPVNGPFLSQRYLPALKHLAVEHAPQALLFSGGHSALDFAANFSCMSGGSCSLSVTGLHCISDGVAAIRRVYGLQLEAEFEFHTEPYTFSIATASFYPAQGFGKPKISEFSEEIADSIPCTDYVETIAEEASLSEHEIVLAGGRGLGNIETAKALEQLGALLEAGIGGTRPAVWNSWFPSSRMIGLSGQTVKPKVCIAFGASGCTPFMKGIDKSGILVAVNSDSNAMIFKQCDLGLVADCGKVIQELIKLLNYAQD